MLQISFSPSTGWFKENITLSKMYYSVTKNDTNMQFKAICEVTLEVLLHLVLTYLSRKLHSFFVILQIFSMHPFHHMIDVNPVVHFILDSLHSRSPSMASWATELLSSSLRYVEAVVVVASFTYFCHRRHPCSSWWFSRKKCPVCCSLLNLVQQLLCRDHSMLTTRSPHQAVWTFIASIKWWRKKGASVQVRA
jgi:hypothetical protein